MERVKYVKRRNKNSQVKRGGMYFVWLGIAIILSVVCMIMDLM